MKNPADHKSSVVNLYIQQPFGGRVIKFEGLSSNLIRKIKVSLVKKTVAKIGFLKSY